MKTKKLIVFLYLASILLSSVLSLEEDNNKEITNVEDLITLVNSKEFQDFVDQEDDDNINLKNSALFSGNECLLSEKEATNLLKSEYGITNNSPDKRIRFILGKCSPVLLIPGIYASKLLVDILLLLS